MARFCARFRRGILLALLTSTIAVALPGCYGSFNLVRSVHRFNGELSAEKWVDELFFLILNIIPVYGLASLGDAIIFNSIEFWSGSNPITAATTTEPRTIATADGRATLSLQPDGRVHVQVVTPDGRDQEFYLRKNEQAVALVSADGDVLKSVSTVNGSPVLFD
ncbi:MAG: DUF3332 family protein [Planctomycetota bacterium]